MAPLAVANAIPQVNTKITLEAIAIAPCTGPGFISDDKAATVTVFDLKTLRKLAEIRGGKTPDALAEYSRALSTFSPVFSGLLRKEQNESDYQGCENCGSIESA